MLVKAARNALRRIRAKYFSRGAEPQNASAREELRRWGDTYYGAKAENYVEIRKKKPAWHIEQAIMQRLLSHVPDEVSVLDVPFGTGRFVDYYFDKRMTIFGLDSSADMIATAERELGGKYQRDNIRVGDALALPFENDRFDLVVSWRFLGGVISLGEAKRAMREVHRVGKRWAILQVKSLNEGAPRKDAAQKNKKQKMGDTLYWDEVVKLVEEIGFSLVEIEKINTSETNTRWGILCQIVKR